MLNIEEACGVGNCCGNKGSNYEELSQLFDNIIEFRDIHKGPKENGNNITGVDIRNYLYYSLLDYQ